MSGVIQKRFRPSDASSPRFAVWCAAVAAAATLLIAGGSDRWRNLFAVPICIAFVAATPPTELRRSMKRSEWLPVLGFFLVLPFLIFAVGLLPIPISWSHPPPWLDGVIRWAVGAFLVIYLVIELRRFAILRRSGAA